MSHFVISYDRSRGDVGVCEKFKNLRDALEHRFALEEKLWGDENTEVVILAAESFQDLLNTHGRYFRSLTELEQALSRSTSEDRLASA